MKQQSTQDETNQQERKGYEMCVDLTHATTFATIDGEASSSLFSYSMTVLMALLAVLFFKQEWASIQYLWFQSLWDYPI